MNLEALATALEVRSDLKTLLGIAERAQFNLFNSDLEENVFEKTYTMISNIILTTKSAIANIELEFNKSYRIGDF